MKKKLLSIIACIMLLQGVETHAFSLTNIFTPLSTWTTGLSNGLSKSFTQSTTGFSNLYTQSIDTFTNGLSKLSNNQKAGIVGIAALGTISGLGYWIYKSQQRIKSAPTEKRSTQAAQHSSFQLTGERSLRINAEKKLEAEKTAHHKTEKELEAARLQVETEKNSKTSAERQKQLAEKALTQIKQRLEQANQDFQQEKLRLEEQHKSIEKGLQEQHKRLVDSLPEEKRAIANKYQESLETLQASLDLTRREYEEEIRRLKDELAKLKTQHIFEKKTLQSLCEQELHKVKQECTELNRRFRSITAKTHEISQKIQDLKQFKNDLRGTVLEFRREAATLMKETKARLAETTTYHEKTMAEMLEAVQNMTAPAREALTFSSNPRHNPFASSRQTELAAQTLPEQHRLLHKYKFDDIEDSYDFDEKENLGVAKHFRITPPGEHDRSKRILLVSVHGTFAGKSDSFGAELTSRASQAYMILAQQLSYLTGQQVDFIAFRWKGHNTRDAREEGGRDLARIVTQYYADNTTAGIETTSWLIGHSHGCNVINNCAYNLLHNSSTNITIDNAVFIASPQLENDPFIRKVEDGYSEREIGRYNIKSLLNIWGHNDTTGCAGSLLTSWFMGNRVTTSLHHAQSAATDEKVRNIRLRYDGKFLNHCNIKYAVVRFLPLILKEINDHFKVAYDLVFNIYPTVLQSDLQEVQRRQFNEDIFLADDDDGFEEKEENTETKAASAAATHETVVEYTTYYTWKIHGAIHEKDPAIALHEAGRQYFGLLPNDIRAAFKQSIDYTEQCLTEFTEKYENKTLRDHPLPGQNFLDEGRGFICGYSEFTNDLWEASQTNEWAVVGDDEI